MSRKTGKSKGKKESQPRCFGVLVSFSTHELAVRIVRSIFNFDVLPGSAECISDFLCEFFDAINLLKVLLLQLLGFLEALDQLVSQFRSFGCPIDRLFMLVFLELDSSLCQHFRSG